MKAKYDLIRSVEAKIGDDYVKCMQLMVACIKSIHKSISRVGLDALDVAERYWIKKGLDPNALEKAREACWQYLDDRGASTNLIEPEFCALRAVICVLYAEPSSDDPSELLEFCFDMITAVTNDYLLLQTEVNRFFRP